MALSVADLAEESCVRTSERVDTPIGREPSPFLERDELRSVVASLCGRNPDRSHAEVHQLVMDVYQKLARDARIHTHLIPLTLNLCRRELGDSTTASTHPPKLH